MTALSWLLAATALLVLPLGDPVAERARLLGLGGRLHVPGTHGRRVTLSAARLAEVPAPLAAVAAFAVVTVRAGPVLGLAAALVTGVAVRLAGDAWRARGADRSAARLLAAMRAVVAELAAGAAPDVALRAAGEVDPARAAVFAAAADAMVTGTDVGAAFAADPELTRIGAAWTLARQTGASLGAVLERVVAELAARREQHRVVAEALAGPRSSAAVLALLPVLGVLLGLAMDADPLGFLFATPTGRLVCLAGVVLDVAGLLWTRRLAAGAVLS